MHLRAALLLVVGSAIAPAAAAPADLPANGTPATEVPQESAKATAAAVTLKGIKLPSGFHISLFALVPGARAMAVAPEGRKLFVGTLEDQVFVLDLKAPGGPVASVKTFAPAIEKTMPHGVCLAPDKTLYLAEQNRILAFPDAAARTEDPTLAAHIVVPQGQLIPQDFESNGHSARVCRVGPDGKLYVAIGQPTNVPTPEQWDAFSKAGLGAIIRMNTDGTHREVFAGGIRNSVGLDFNPADKSLWFTDNQVDMMGDDIPPGEINRADKPGQTFGFPWYGGGHVRTSQWKDSTPPADSVFPQVEMQAHAADLGMTFYRGTAFPAAYRGGIFSAQHGSWNRTKPVGAQIMFTAIGADGKAKATPFAQGWLAASGTYKGKPADVAELTDGSLLVSDDKTGAIYKIEYNAK